MRLEPLAGVTWHWPLVRGFVALPATDHNKFWAKSEHLTKCALSARLGAVKGFGIDSEVRLIMRGRPFTPARATPPAEIPVSSAAR